MKRSRKVRVKNINKQFTDFIINIILKYLQRHISYRKNYLKIVQEWLMIRKAMEFAQVTICQVDLFPVHKLPSCIRTVPSSSGTIKLSFLVHIKRNRLIAQFLSFCTTIPSFIRTSFSLHSILSFQIFVICKLLYNINIVTNIFLH